VKNKSEKGFHLAGVIPVSKFETDFETFTHPSLLMVGKNFLAVERSIAECAFAGCETIWICADDDIEPFIRKRIGDYVLDPVWVHRDFAKKDPRFYPKDEQKIIPIYYVPFEMSERERLDSYGWGVVTAARMAMHVCSGLSRWLAPDMFYASFPSGLYNFSFLRSHRREISSTTNFSVFSKGKSYLQNAPLGFTFSPEDLKNIVQDVRKKTSKSYEVLNEEEYRLLPKSEQWAAKTFTIAEVFEAISDKEQNKIEIKEYNNINTWEEYAKYLSGETLRCPESIFTRTRLPKIKGNLAL
jgi:hypothetical protein